MHDKSTWVARVRPLLDMGEHTLVPLTRGAFAVIDTDDAAKIGIWNWHAWPASNGSLYARRNRSISNRKQRPIGLHHEILGVDSSVEIDHADRDPLNCRKSNLRIASKLENCRNRGVRSDSVSGFKGVGWRSESGKWRARIEVGGKRLSLGNFDSAEEAARAYDIAAVREFGAFAVTNFPMTS